MVNKGDEKMEIEKSYFAEVDSKMGGSFTVKVLDKTDDNKYFVEVVDKGWPLKFYRTGNELRNIRTSR
jgi:hypothetical protein